MRRGYREAAIRRMVNYRQLGKINQKEMDKEKMNIEKKRTKDEHRTSNTEHRMKTKVKGEPSIDD